MNEPDLDAIQQRVLACLGAAGAKYPDGLDDPHWQNHVSMGEIRQSLRELRELREERPRLKTALSLSDSRNFFLAQEVRKLGGDPGKFFPILENTP